MSKGSKQRAAVSRVEALERQVTRPERAMRYLVSATQELNAAENLTAGLERVAQSLKLYVPYETFGVLLLDELGRELRFAHAEGFPPAVVEHWRFGLGQGIVGTVAANGQPIRVDDVGSDPRYIAASDTVRSELAIPLIVKERVIGVLDVGASSPHFFTPADEDLLGLLADHLAGAIESARLYQNMLEQARSLSLLHEISREMTSILNRRQLLKRVAERLRRLIDYDLFSVLLWSEEKQALEPVFSVYGDGSRVEWASPVPIGHGICGTAAALRQPIRVPNVHLDPRYISCVTDIEVRSELVVPLVFEDRLIGVMDVESSRYDAFSNRHQQLLSTLGSSLAIALENARLYEKLRHDESRLEKDLSTAREVQKQLLPKTTPWVRGLQIGVGYAPARHLGGDFYDFVPFGGGRVAVAVGDVAGKATSAALIGSLAIGTLREFAVTARPSPGETLREMNQKLFDLGFDSRFVAMVFALYEPEGQRLRLANSGLPYPYLLSRGGVERIEARGMPLGLFPDRTYREALVELEPGDSLVLLSDGIEDTVNAHDEEFGRERVVEALSRLAGESAKEIADGVLAAARSFAGSAEAYDDSTIVVLKLAVPPGRARLTAVG